MDEVALNGGLYKRDNDQKLRRSMYTYWKRSAPMPNMVAFDAPTREMRNAAASHSTPMQALVTMNDVQSRPRGC